MRKPCKGFAKSNRHHLILMATNNVTKTMLTFLTKYSTSIQSARSITWAIQKCLASFDKGANKYVLVHLNKV